MNVKVFFSNKKRRFLLKNEQKTAFAEEESCLKGALY
jgi:hypothetical protein